MVLKEVQELCGSLEIDFEDEDIQGTFNKIRDAFIQHQKESENEKKLRNQIEGSLQELQQKLEQKEREISHSEQKLILEKEQSKQQEERINKVISPVTCIVY